MSLPPNINQDDCVILFDGECKLCNVWSNFIIKFDRLFKFKLCSVQSTEGQKILTHFNFPTETYETMLYVEGPQFYQRSDAFFRVIKKLGMPWKLVCIFTVLPKQLCDWLYDRIALNRYRLFGKYDYCRLPTADHDERYVREQ